MSRPFGLAAWLHTLNLPHGRDDMEKIVVNMAEHDFDVLIACIKNDDGYLDYQSKVGDVRPCFADRDPLAELTKMGRKHGLRIHAWICTYAEGEHSALRKKHPEIQGIQIPQRASTDAKFACTARPEVKQYIKDIGAELVDNYDIEAVHFDYVRTTGSFCYCEVCRAKCLELLGCDLMGTAPWRPPQSELWHEWRCANITEVVAAVAQRAHAAGKHVSAAVCPGYPTVVMEQAQNWIEWLRAGHLDWAYPMNYNSLDRVVADYTRCHVAVAPDASRIWEGLYFNSQYPPEKMERQVRSVAECGTGGMVVFEIRYINDDMYERLKRLKAELST